MRDVGTALIAIGLGAALQLAVGGILWLGCALERRIEPPRTWVPAPARRPAAGEPPRAMRDVPRRDAA